MPVNALCNHGLTEKQLSLITSVLTSKANIESAWLFGSRALGSYKPSSDIDIALEGENISTDDVADILIRLEQSTLPYKVDIVVIHKIKSQALLEHIREYGQRWI